MEKIYKLTNRGRKNVRISRVHIFLSCEFLQSAVYGAVGVIIDQAGGIEPHCILWELNCWSRRRQTVLESRLWCTRNCLSAEAFGLFVGAIPIGIAVLLDAVCHCLEPRGIGSVTLLTCHWHRVHGRIHIHRHVHVHVVLFGECSAIEIKGGERVVTCLATEVLVQGKAEAHDTTLCCTSILDDARQRQDKEGDGGTHSGRVCSSLGRRR